jgi:hypothetical protein
MSTAANPEQMRAIGVAVTKFLMDEFATADLNTRVFGLIAAAMAEIAYASETEQQMRSRIDRLLDGLARQKEIFVGSWAMISRMPRRES